MTFSLWQMLALCIKPYPATIPAFRKYVMWQGGAAALLFGRRALI
ncbi:hypothetical protein [Aquitalea palustris]|nr:hypothetical protein [Aquitalea palustris]